MVKAHMVVGGLDVDNHLIYLRRCVIRLRELVFLTAVAMDTDEVPQTLWSSDKVVPKEGSEARVDMYPLHDESNMGELDIVESEEQNREGQLRVIPEATLGT